MTQRAHELSATADGQIAELIDLLGALDQAALRRPCPGREKLGDGTIGAAARHTADNYERIAAFVETSDRMSAAYDPAAHGGHRIPRFFRALGHGPQDDSQLDAIPPKDSFRFCDGQRTLEQVLAGLLKHQVHQVEALKTAAA